MAHFLKKDQFWKYSLPPQWTRLKTKIYVNRLFLCFVWKNLRSQCHNQKLKWSFITFDYTFHKSFSKHRFQMCMQDKLFLLKFNINLNKDLNYFFDFTYFCIVSIIWSFNLLVINFPRVCFQGNSAINTKICI